MTSRHGGNFELAVAGSLGPVLRSTLRSYAVSPPQSLTTVRFVGVEVDLVRLVESLQARGVRIEAVWREREA